MKKFDKYEKFGAYHWAAYEDTQSEYRAHVDHVVNWLAGEASILDVGAGDGLITSKLGAIAIEENELAVSLAQEKGANVQKGSVYNLPQGDKRLDAVFLGDVIEHLEKPEKALAEIHRVLIDGGRLYVVWPSEGVVDEYAHKHYPNKELLALVEANGFASDGEAYAIKSRNYARFIKQSTYANHTKKEQPTSVAKGKKAF